MCSVPALNTVSVSMQNAGMETIHTVSTFFDNVFSAVQAGGGTQRWRYNSWRQSGRLKMKERNAQEQWCSVDVMCTVPTEVQSDSSCRWVNARLLEERRKSSLEGERGGILLLPYGSTLLPHTTNKRCSVLNYHIKLWPWMNKTIMLICGISPNSMIIVKLEG